MAVELSSIKLAPDAERHLLETASGARRGTFAFRDIDVLEIGSTVKKSIVAHVGRAVHMLLEGVSCSDHTEARRLLSVAHTEGVQSWRLSVGGEVQVCRCSVVRRLLVVH